MNWCFGEGQVTGQVIDQVMGQVMGQVMDQVTGQVEDHVIQKGGRWAESEKQALKYNMMPFLESCYHATSVFWEFGYSRDWGTSKGKFNSMSVVCVWDRSTWGVWCGVCQGDQY